MSSDSSIRDSGEVLFNKNFSSLSFSSDNFVSYGTQLIVTEAARSTLTSSTRIQGFGPISTKSYAFGVKVIKPTISFSEMNDNDLYAHIKLATTALKIETATFLTARFYDIICPRATKVSNIHANYINNSIIEHRGVNSVQLSQDIKLEDEISFIASQSPIHMPAYQNLTLSYWQTILDTSDIILDLTTTAEIRPFGTNDLGEVTPYYPTALDETVEFGDKKRITIKLLQEENIEDIGKLYKYAVSHNEESIETPTKEISRFHFSKWNDFSDVSIPMLESMLSKIDATKKHFVHCRAGVGRTGTLIASYYLKSKIGKGEVTKENLNEFVYNLIIDLRLQRGPRFVQSEPQFKMIMAYSRHLLGL